jgi:ABC-type Fe3+/spermidine/putrescine transport system ATPase subunit
MASQPSLFGKFQASRDPVSKEMRDTAKRTTHTHITLTHRQRESVSMSDRDTQKETVYA